MKRRQPYLTLTARHKLLSRAVLEARKELYKRDYRRSADLVLLRGLQQMADEGRINEKDLERSTPADRMTLQQRHLWLIRWCWQAREELEAGQTGTRVDELLGWAHDTFGTYVYT